VVMTASQMHIADIVAADEAERHSAYQRAWEAYDGEGPTYLEVEDDVDDNIRFDYPALIVDKGVSFLVGKEGGVALQVKAEPQVAEDDEVDPEDEAAAEQTAEEASDEAAAILGEAWPEHQRQLDFHNLTTNGGVCGHAWARLYENGRVAVLDPANCSAEWNEDDVSIVERYIVQWNTVDPEDGLGVVRRWRIEPDNAQAPSSWTTFLEEHDDDTSSWRLLDETLWPYDFAPIIDTQNLPSPNTFYGRPDLSKAILDMVEQLESLASDMRRIARLHGHPIPVVIGEDSSRIANIEVAIGSLLAIPNEKAKLGQLVVAELTSLLELFKELKTSLFEAARIPKVALGETGNAGPTTGVALKVEYEPLVEKTETKHLTYGYLFIEIARRILALRKRENLTVMASWSDPVPSDPKADSEADEADLRMGIVSKQTVAEKRGLDWSTEQERIAEESKGSAEAMARAFNRGEVEDE
jgi:Phage portal protein, SPP1 Gp6-like